MTVRDVWDLFPKGIIVSGIENGIEKALPPGTTFELDPKYAKLEGRWEITQYYDDEKGHKRFTAISGISSREFCADELVLAAVNIELPTLCQKQ